jgi:hypothetical protein
MMLTGHPEVTRPLSVSSAVSGSLFHLSSGRSADFESFAEDELASMKMSQDFWGWVGKLELRARHPAAGA